MGSLSAVTDALLLHGSFHKLTVKTILHKAVAAEIRLEVDLGLKPDVRIFLIESGHRQAFATERVSSFDRASWNKVA